MLAGLANIFGYLLNFLYELVKNYGVSIILFTVIIKIIMLPISIKQQKTMKKSAKIQEKMKEIQDKYKNNPEKLNQETIQLYKTEKMSPFSGCLSAIVQIVLILAIFYLVKSPLTYMKKVDANLIKQYTDEIQQTEGKNNAYPEIAIINQKSDEDEKVYINMNFLGLDLSSVPSQKLNDWKVYVIPVLYVITSFISIKLATKMQSSKKKEEVIDNKSDNIKDIEVTDKSNKKMQKKEDDDSKNNELDAVSQANKSMSYITPIMSVSIAAVAPLGLALYWLVSNILMIIERIVLNKFIKDKEEEEI